MDKTLSWFGNFRDKFDNFRLDIDDIINQVSFEYAENQLLTAGANVKQFCSEFVEEMLPESIINSLKKKPYPSVVEQLRSDVNEGPTTAPSDESSSFAMEISETDYIDSPFETETYIGKDLCFEELRFRDIEVSQVESYGHESLPQSPSSSRTAKVKKLSEPVNKLIMLDTRKLSLVPDLPEETFISQGAACKSCSIVQSDKKCGCRRITSAVDGNAVSVTSKGESQSVPLVRRESEVAEQDICESDWVIV